MSGTLLGSLAFVTGAGSGIGRATCKVLAREGATVVAADKNLKSALDTVEQLPKKSDQNHLGLDFDVGKLDSVQTVLSKTLDVYKKPPTIIVNSAGITRDNFLVKLSEEDFDEVININLKGTFLVIQAFSKSIIDHGLTNASIINLASIVGKNGNIGQANYCASKAGVESMTKVAAKEFGKFGIRVNAILPGFISTPMTDVVPDKVKDKFIAIIPLARMGKPEEVAEVVTFLASDKSSYVNGTSIEVTGGM